MANKPKIRFKQHHEEWEEKKLKNEVVYSSTGLQSSDVSNTGNYNLFDANGIIGKVNTFVSDEPYISIIKDGSGVGRVRLLPKFTSVLSTMGIISPKDGNDINFIFNLIQNIDLKQFIISGAIPHIYFKNYGESTIAVPSLPEQQKIGEFFAALDELIGAKEEELEKLKQLKQALLQQMFPCEDDNNTLGGGDSQIINTLNNHNLTISTKHNTPHIRFKGFTKEWEKVKLKDKANFTKGRGYTKSDIIEEGVSIILYGTLYTNYKTFIENSIQYASTKQWSLLSKGTEVIVPASGETSEDIARASAIVRKGIIIGGDLNVILPNKDINSCFLALELTYGKSHKQLVKKAQGISVVHLHNSDIEELDILVPTIEEQQMIGDFFRQQDEQIAAAQQQITKLKIIKQALLQKMFAA